MTGFAGFFNPATGERKRYTPPSRPPTATWSTSSGTASPAASSPNTSLHQEERFTSPLAKPTSPCPASGTQPVLARPSSPGPQALKAQPLTAEI